MGEHDIIELRMDDPTFEDWKYTNDDDTCSELVYGWELDYYMDNEDDNLDFESGETFHVWFSRKTG